MSVVITDLIAVLSRELLGLSIDIKIKSLNHCGAEFGG